jgi:hypothetical protein
MGRSTQAPKLAKCVEAKFPYFIIWGDLKKPRPLKFVEQGPNSSDKVV